VYPTDLPLQGQRNLARLYVGWLYYYHRHPLNLREYSYLEASATACELLGYTTSVYRDHQALTFYESKCLQCGTCNKGMASLHPFSSSCYSCAQGEPNYLALLNLLHVPVSPMAIVFELLPIVVQNIIQEILLDLETHPRYNPPRIEE
jgi:hypothetical protein